MSIDAISMRKGKGSLVTVVSDIEGGNLIEMINSHRQPDIIEALIKQLTRKFFRCPMTRRSCFLVLKFLNKPFTYIKSGVYFSN